MDKKREKRFLGISPYPMLDTFRVLWHNLVIKRRKRKQINFIPKKYRFNDLKPQYTIGIIGDIMGTGLKEVNFSQHLQTFYSDCDYLLGNFEGTFYDGDKKFYLKKSLRRKLPMHLVSLGIRDIGIYPLRITILETFHSGISKDP